MKKVAFVLALMMVLGAAPGWCVSVTLDGFIERRTQSEMHPVEDAGHVLGLANDSVKKTLEFADPVLKHRKVITDPIMDGTKTVVNGTWGLIRKVIPLHRLGDRK